MDGLPIDSYTVDVYSIDDFSIDELRIDGFLIEGFPTEDFPFDMKEAWSLICSKMNWTRSFTSLSVCLLYLSLSAFCFLCSRWATISWSEIVSTIAPRPWVTSSSASWGR